MREFLSARVDSCLLILILFFTPAVVRLRGAQVHTPASKLATSTNESKAHPDTEKAAMPVAVSPDRAIPLPQIADRAVELNHLLREISSQLTPKTELLEANQKAEAQTLEIRQRARQAGNLLSDLPTPMELEDEQRYWSSRHLGFTKQRKLLAARAANLEEQIETLDGQLPDWQATWERIHALSGIDVVVNRVQEGLAAIRTMRSQVQEQLNLVLTIQNQVSQLDQQISDVLALVRQVRERERGRLLETDSRPIWEASEQQQHYQTGGFGFYRSFDRSFTTAGEYLREHKLGALGLVVSYFLVLLGVFRLRRYVCDNAWLEVPPGARRLLNAPFSVALLITLLGTRGYAASAPITVTFVLYLLYTIPVLRLLAPMIDPRVRGLLYVLAAAYLVEGVYQLVQLPPVLKRQALALITLTALLSFGWLIRPSRRLPTPGRSGLILTMGIRVCLLLLATSLVANLVGYVSLSQILGLASLVGPFVAATLYCGARVLTLILSIVLRIPWVQNVHELRAHVVERWLGRLLGLGALLLWMSTLLHLLTIHDYVMGELYRLLRQPIGFERVNFTLIGALVVLLVLLGGYALANALTFCLKKFVIARLPLQRGLPYAISTVIYYLSLLLVGLAALSAAGVELTKFTVLTGAIGVGLGFGLQNIVNNFVSGLILIFERPIHVGDIVDVGGLTGTVRRIGARSSTVLTFKGAEVIVPNSNLLSNQVINWTLSSQWCRVDVSVRVAYGTDPEQLIKLLERVAQSHPGVLLQRPPTAFFLGFGESALNFELRFWSAQQDTWFQLQSDVTVAVAKALHEAGIEVPFPQRELRVRSMDAPAADKLASSGLRLL